MHKKINTLLAAATVIAFSAQAYGWSGRTEVAEQFRRTFLEATQLMDKGQYLEAEKTLLTAMEWSEKARPDTRFADLIARQLASLYLNLGRYREAEKAARRAVALSEKNAETDIVSLAVDLGYLAMAYYSQGLYRKAEPLFRRALALDIAAFGPTHPETAKMRANLACLYAMLGQYSQAEELHREALKHLESALGPDDPAVAVELSNVAILRFTQGAVGEAADLLQAAVGIFEKKPPGSRLGETLANLGVMLRHLGKPAQAHALFTRAVPLLEQTLGPEHPHMAVFLDEYAKTLRAVDRKKEAKLMRRRAQAVFEKYSQENVAARTVVDVRALR